MCLSAFFHHHLFFPGKLDWDLANCVNKFGYADKGSVFLQTAMSSCLARA